MSAFSDIQIAAEIVSRAQAGDTRAQESLYRTFAPATYTLLRRLSGGPDLARDLLQNTFVAVLLNLGNYRNEAPLGYWIRRIAVNQAMMYFRSPWHRKRQALPEVPDHESFPKLVSTPQADLTDLASAFACLDHAARTVVWLHEVEGYTHSEIGTLLGKSASYSKTRLARALETLRKWREDQDGHRPCIQISNS